MIIEIILGSIVFVAIILLIIVIYHNRFKYAIIKMEEAENNIDLFLQKKIDLLSRMRPLIMKELKLKEFLEEIEDMKEKELNHFQMNDLLRNYYNELFSVLDDNEKLFKSEAITEIINEVNYNEEDLVASIKFYNDTVVIYNQLIVSFPSNIIRLFFHYKKREFYSHEKREIYEILKEK